MGTGRGRRALAIVWGAGVLVGGGPAAGPGVGAQSLRLELDPDSWPPPSLRWVARTTGETIRQVEFFVARDGHWTWELAAEPQAVDPVSRTAALLIETASGPDALILAAADAEADGDEDSVSDARERLVYRTDPARADTDRDQLPDGWEIAHRLDPLDDGSGDSRQGGGGDFDADRLTNREELHLGLSPRDPDGLLDPSPALRVYNVFDQP